MGLFSRRSKGVAPRADGGPPGSSGPSALSGSNGAGRADAGAHAGVTGDGARDEARIQALGLDLLTRARGRKGGLLSAKFYSDALMEWSMKDQAFKVQLFRFVDAFPVLRDADDTFEHLRDYLSQPGVTVPGVIAAAMKAGSLAKGLAVGQIGRQITAMAEKFIAGRDAAGALPSLRARWDEGIGFSVDLLGEACVSDREADAYRDKYLDLIDNLPGLVAPWPARSGLEHDHLGPIPRTNVSVKISSLSARCDPIDPAGAQRDLLSRLRPILESAARRGVFVNFDMEQRALKDFTLDLFMRCAEEIDFPAGLAMQAYLRSGEADARRICEWATRRGRTVTVRLVKGAYWDYEVIHSEQMGWPCPVWTTKRDTDACFERMTEIFLDACPRGDGQPSGRSGAAGSGGVKLALGSHNIRSIAAALAGLERRGLPREALELQMLHGMADELKAAAAEMGLRVREYVPVGEMIPGMAYLVRRLLENTSNESWLKAGFLDQADPAVLLASPHGPGSGNARGHAGVPATTGDASTIGTAEPSAGNLERAPERHRLTEPVTIGGRSVGPFFNEPLRDFALSPAREAFAAAVAAARVPGVANDRTPADAADMAARAQAAFDAWRDTPADDRAGVLLRAADLIRQRRDELAGVMIKEAGKTWREADGDVCEAIDFCEYYARLAPGLFRRDRLGRFIGELDETLYEPRGVAVVIAPWNFPLAICCGMTVAALVTGNPVIVKPAEQTPGVAAALHGVLQRAVDELAARRPELAPHRGALVQLCPGPGGTTGASLVRDERVALIAFTGSRDVGCDILNAAAPPSPLSGPRERFEAFASAPGAHVKRVVCEMGGKNAIIIDTSADPDESVLGVRQSAFGFQGQKCSACSRVIVVDPEGPDGPASVRFRERLVEAMRALTIGDPARPGTDIGPVIDEEARAKIEGAIARAKQSGLRWAGLSVPEGLTAATGRAFVAPHVFWTVPPEHELARDEIFGPVLAVMHAGSFEAALRLAQATPYRLTGGVFSRKPAHLELAKRAFRVGNLYLNRGITGALVARQPFGGGGMSGVGSKAGGRDYLLQFVEPRAICENTLRRGFAPEL